MSLPLQRSEISWQQIGNLKKTTKNWDFPGGPVVKTPNFRTFPAGGEGPVPGQGTKILHAVQWPNRTSRPTPPIPPKPPPKQNRGRLRSISVFWKLTAVIAARKYLVFWFHLQNFLPALLLLFTFSFSTPCWMKRKSVGISGSELFSH